MRHRWIRRLASAVVGCVTLVVAFVAVIYAVTTSRVRRRYDVVATSVPVVNDSTTIARGAHLAAAIGKCADCHGADYGGRAFIDDPALGRIVATNLTSGGALGRYTDAELARAIRHGVRNDGTGLLLMPSRDFAGLSDEDVGALIAYLRSLPPVTRALPPTDLRVLARALWTAGQLPLMDAADMDHATRAPVHVTAAATADYGRYLANVGGCTGCHGPGLSGGKIPGAPPDWKPAANLTPAGSLGRWSDAEFRQALRSGRRPDGTPIDTIMPWKAAGRMTDEEIAAVYAYLKTVPPRAYGTR